MQGASPAPSGPPLAFAISRFHVGDTDPSGTPDYENGWKQYGYSIDGVMDTATSTNVCQPQAGSPHSLHDSGNGGIDNSFGHFVLPILASLDSEFPNGLNQAVVEGRLTTLVLLSGLGPASDYSSIQALVVSGAPLDNPAWDGTDRWPVDSRSVGGNSLSTALLQGPAYMNSRVFVTHLQGSGLLGLAVLGEVVQVPITHVTLSMTVSDDGLTASSGVISGILLPDGLGAAIRRTLGVLTESFCSGSETQFIVTQVAETSDFMADGTQDPALTCNGISIGLGFEAVRVSTGDVVTVPPAPNPCCQTSLDGGDVDAGGGCDGGNP